MENNKFVDWSQKFSKHKFHEHIGLGEVYRSVKVFAAKPARSSQHHERWGKARCEKWMRKIY